MHTQKKKIALVMRGCCHDERGSLHMVSEQVQPVTWDRYEFR
jgi:hypothetical protein